MKKILLIYKTTHKNGRYYIGKHETNDVNDGYLGSGNWVKSIKDILELSREILTEATSEVELRQLEEYYIALHYDDPLNMNFKRASVGLTSADASERIRSRMKNGTAPFQDPIINSKRLSSLAITNNRKAADGSLSILKPETMQKVRLINSQRGQQQFIDGTSPLLRPEVKEKTRNITKNRISGLVADNKHGYQNKDLLNRVTKHNRELIERNEFHTQQLDFKLHQSNTQLNLVQSGNHMTQVVWECENCGKSGKGMSNYTRWHGNSCKEFP